MPHFEYNQASINTQREVMSKLSEIQAKIAELKKEEEKIRVEERNKAIEEIKSLMAAYSIKASELKGSVGSAKYKDANGNSWSGKGKMPKWMADAVAAGKTREWFLSK
jgi:DNA-binding protein H-NS